MASFQRFNSSNLLSFQETLSFDLTTTRNLISMFLVLFTFAFANFAITAAELHLHLRRRQLPPRCPSLLRGPRLLLLIWRSRGHLHRCPFSTRFKFKINYYL